MCLPNLPGYFIQNTLLCRCVCYAKNPNAVVVGEKYPPSFHAAADGGATW